LHTGDQIAEYNMFQNIGVIAGVITVLVTEHRCILNSCVSVANSHASRATFPGGTITGVPKVRCMEIIDELEPVRRGPYTGSIGWLGFNGDMDLNIIIRTFVIQNGRAHVQVGAGIVADSDPEREYYETLHKANALLQTLKSI